MAIKVKAKDKYGDVTFCTNHKCRKRTCFRHICHCADKYLHSEADFDGQYYYCLKEYEKAKELLKNTMTENDTYEKNKTILS